MPDPTPPTAPPTGLLLIVSGPSGVGKSTIVNRMLDQLDARLSVSLTTRPQADTETDGEHYHFVDDASFTAARDRDELLEWALVHGNYYATPRTPVVEALRDGRVVILEIDVEGARQVKAKLPEARAIFVLPPDEQALLDRLRSRRREDEATIQRRFARAQQEIDDARGCGVYDTFLVNRDLDRAVAEAVHAVQQQLQAARSPTT
jgi:guanylate kinase